LKDNESVQSELAQDISNIENWTEEKKAKLRAYEQAHEVDIAQKLDEWWKEGKGPFNKQGGYINYHEWHSFFIGGGLIDLAFRLQEGAFIYFYLFVGIKVLKDTGKRCKTPKDFTGELAKNFHYFIIAGIIAAVLWVELTNAQVPKMTLGLADSIAALAA